MAAIDATLRLVKAGEHVIVSDNTYGGTFRLFSRILTNYNLEFDFVDTSDVSNVEAAIKPNTKMVFIETPTNPVMIVSDMQAISDVAHRSGAIVVCDNTFMSPYLQRPLEFGVDIVVHSTTNTSTAIRTAWAALRGRTALGSGVEAEGRGLPSIEMSRW